MLRTFYKKGSIEAGCDEAGRGCLAGPVFAAAVILPPDYVNSKLDDSKKLTENQRLACRKDIEMNAIAWAVASVDNKKIDEINILNASILAMHLALDKLCVTPTLVLVDGNRFKPFRKILHKCIIRGDGKFQSIAAASILAKTYRDEYMSLIHQEFDCYNWNKNKGYPTQWHKSAITENGISPYHRRSFRLNEQLKFHFP